MLFKEVVGKIANMPIIKGATKALRQTKKRTYLNQAKVLALRQELAKFKKSKKPTALARIYQLVDKMAKTGVIHKNKAARIKSSASKLVSVRPAKK